MSTTILTDKEIIIQQKKTIAILQQENLRLQAELRGKKFHNKRTIPVFDGNEIKMKSKKQDDQT